MDRLPPLSPESFVEKMRGEVERVLGEVAEAVNKAPTGRVITDSEEKVRNLMSDLRRTVYETAVQMRVDEAEKSFFSSDRRGPRAEDA